jgi:TolB-like protein/Flp pilus assembly protein TadD
MSQQPSLGDFARHAKRGFFWRALGVYVLGSWIALQVVDVLVSSFGLPEWFPGFALALLVIGLPIILATAIVQQGLAGGVPGGKAPGDPGAEGTAAAAVPEPPSTNVAAGTGSLDRPTTRPPKLYRLLTWKNAITGGVLAFALWGVLATLWLGSTRWIAGDGGRTANGLGDDALKAIAVLPFDNLSSDTENAHFADGIHEDVLTQLSKIADLTVISRTSVLAYRETALGMSEIAGELGVGSILEGSVRRSGDNVRITAQLIDARTDEHLWADNFDRALTAANVFAIQTEIAQQIAAALRATLSPQEASRIARRPTDDLTAYDLYIRGREVYQTYTPEDNDEAIRLFREVLEIDPDYAEAWAGIADAFGQRVLLFGYAMEWADSARTYAQKAIELAPEVAAGYKALALTYSVEAKYERSLEANLQAVARDPNHHGATNNIGVDYARKGQHDEALRWYKRSTRLNPTTFGPANVAATYAVLGDFERADRVYAEQVDVDGNSGPTRAVYGTIIELHRGDLAAAVGMMERWRAESENQTWYLAFDALIALADHDPSRALAITDRLAETAPGANPWAWYHLQTARAYATYLAGDSEVGTRLLEVQARDLQQRLDAGADHAAFIWEIGAIHAALGRREEALDFAERSRAAGFQAAQRYYAEFDPMMDSVRDDPRFQTLVEDSRREIAEMRQRVEHEEIAAGER